MTKKKAQKAPKKTTVKKNKKVAPKAAPQKVPLKKAVKNEKKIKFKSEKPQMVTISLNELTLMIADAVTKSIAALALSFAPTPKPEPKNEIIQAPEAMQTRNEVISPDDF